MSRRPIHRTGIITSWLTILLLGVAASADTPVAVSPGATGRLGKIMDVCPTFSWSYLEGARTYELIVYEMPDGAEEEELEAEPVLQESLPRGVSSWTPPVERCLEAGGHYAWTVRAETAMGLGEWSEPRLFTIRGGPTPTEVREALSLLQGYVADGGVLEELTVNADATDERGRSSRSSSSFGQAHSPTTEASLSAFPGLAAIRGEQTDATGETYGVQGITQSSSDESFGVIGEATSATGTVFGVAGVTSSVTGAGVIAANLVNGPDLVLVGEPDSTFLSEAGVDKPSASPVTFSFSNSGAGAMTLDLDGVPLLTTATDQDTLGALTCAAGEVAKRVGGLWTCATDLDTNTTYSPGFGLDLATTTFSVDTGEIQSRVDGSCTVGQSIRAVNADGTVVCEAAQGPEPASLFGSFGGDGTTDRVVSGTQNLGAVVARYRNLTVPAGSILVVDQGFAYIAASGTCSIGGTIDAVGRGRAGAIGLVSATAAPGLPGSRAAPIEVGFGMSGYLNAAPVSFAVSGSGGGGAGANAGGGSLTSILARGGDGGGASTRGGKGGCIGCPSGPFGDTATWNPVPIVLATGGAFGFDGTPQAETDAFASFLIHPGAGGGSGAVGSLGGTSGAGGNGGGVVYLECNTLAFTGSILATGTAGGDASGDAGGGGGGGGGVVLLRTRSISTSTGSINILEGSGGNGLGTGAAGGRGLFGFYDIVELP